MPTRFVLKPFSSGVDANGDITTGQFGSFVEEGSVPGSSGTLTTDPNTIQGLQSWTTGWTSATDQTTMLPRIREMNGVQYVLSSFAIQNHSDGITYWQAGMSVTANQSVVQYDGKLYLNITGTNTATAPDSDTTNWSYILDLTKEYVDTTSAQNISGIKTLTSNVRTDGAGFKAKNFAYNSANEQVLDQLINIPLFDKDNVQRANITSGVPSANVFNLGMAVRDTSGTQKTYLALNYNKSTQNAYVSCTTPALTATGNEVITASWFNQKSVIPKLNFANRVNKGTSTFRLGAGEYGFVSVGLVAPNYGSSAEARLSGNPTGGFLFAACGYEGLGAGMAIVKPNDYIVLTGANGGYCNFAYFIPFA